MNCQTCHGSGQSKCVALPYGSAECGACEGSGVDPTTLCSFDCGKTYGEHWDNGDVVEDCDGDARPMASAFRIHDLLYDINAGLIVVEPDCDPDEVWAGNVTYRTDTAWIIVVFNDCGEFDYIDHLIDPQGQRFDWDSAGPIGLLIRRWRPPSQELVERIWGIHSQCIGEINHE